MDESEAWDLLEEYRMNFVCEYQPSALVFVADKDYVNYANQLEDYDSQLYVYFNDVRDIVETLMRHTGWTQVVLEADMNGVAYMQTINKKP